MSEDELDKVPLEELYEAYLDGEIDEDEATEALRQREMIASRIFTTSVMNLSQTTLDEYLVTLQAASQEEVGADPAKDAARRERVRVQMDTVLEELERRDRVVALADSGGRLCPGRNQVIRSIQELKYGARDGQAAAQERLARIKKAITKATLRENPGYAQVAMILRTLAPDQNPDLGQWTDAAAALQFLSDPEWQSELGLPLTNLLTDAQARVAWRILVADSREDGRFEGSDWPLDLTPIEVAAAVEMSSEAYAEWVRREMCVIDIQRYMSAVVKEEDGRPAPSTWIVPGKEARRLAKKAGGMPKAFVYGIDPGERPHVARQIWTEGLPPLATDQNGEVVEIGLTLHLGEREPIVRAANRPHGRGVTCFVVARDEEILRLGSADYPKHDELVDELTQEATRLTADDAEYQKMLRNSLLQRGFRVIERHDLDGSQPELPLEVIILDPSPERVLVARESVPNFLHRQRPLRIPGGLEKAVSDATEQEGGDQERTGEDSS